MCISLIIFILMLITAMFVVVMMRLTSEITKIEKNFDNKIINLRSCDRKLKYFMPLDQEDVKIFDELFTIEQNSTVWTSLLIERLVNAYKQEEVLTDSNVRIVNYDNKYAPLIEQHLQMNTKFFTDDRYWKIQSVDYGMENIEVTFVVV